MIILKRLTLKNFMSIGEMEQTIDLDSNNTILVLGENNDMVTQDQLVARNAAGKTTITQGLSFALYGQALTNIKRDNLVNNINNKNMFVILEFEAHGKKYKIERGRKPAFFRFYVNDQEVNSLDVDEAQGESKLTQVEVEKIVGMSHTLFKHIVMMNTSVEPFLKLPSRQQREFIEELLGMRILSEKAETLKVLRDYTKQEIQIEDTKISTVQLNNDRIEKNILDLYNKSEQWDINHQKKLEEKQREFDDLSHVDIDTEIANHLVIQKIREITQQIDKLTREKNSISRELSTVNYTLDRNTAALEKAIDHKCPTCSQEIIDDTHNDVINELTISLENDSKKVNLLEDDIKEKSRKIDVEQQELEKLGKTPNTFHNTISQAYNHKTSLELCSAEISKLSEQTNPFTDQINTLVDSGIQEVDFTNMNELVKLRDHQDILLKLLNNNDSFIRKKIIDQNISYLNDRLSKYLDKVGLPHIVTFQSDLTVSISNFGRDLDFENLSRGERTRLILSLSWAFRDIYELLVHPINIVFIDELLDLGADQQLVETALGVLRRMNTERGKSVWLISHKDDLQSKIPTVLKVIKEAGFSSFNFETEQS